MSALIRSALVKASVKLKAEPFFLITLIITGILSIVSKPHLSAIRWNVIAILFSQMLVCAAFDDCRLLTALAEKILTRFRTPKVLGFAMVFLTGILAMLITNDIALLTIVPLTLQMAKMTGKPPTMLIILETISANIFSALTPFGNPQNLYLYTFFKIPTPEFFSLMLPFGAAGVVLLCLFTAFTNKGDAHKFEKSGSTVTNPKLITGALLSFILNILAVLRVVDFRFALGAAVLIFILLAPKLFRQVDVVLLSTFVLFFLFTDAVTAIPAIKNMFAAVLRSGSSVLLTSAGLSQVISNVPAAVLLAGFTPHYRELLYGVSVGGLGTLIASLSSLISYKIYVREYEPKKYLKLFLIVNFVMLAILLATLLVYTAL